MAPMRKTSATPLTVAPTRSSGARWSRRATDEATTFAVLPWRTVVDSAAVRLFAAIDASHADVLNDDYPMEMIDAEIRELAEILTPSPTGWKRWCARRSLPRGVVDAEPCAGYQRDERDASVSVVAPSLTVDLRLPPAQAEAQGEDRPDGAHRRPSAADAETCAIGAIACQVRTAARCAWKPANATAAGSRRMATDRGVCGSLLACRPPAAQTHRGAVEGCDVAALSGPRRSCDGWTLSIEQAIAGCCIAVLESRKPLAVCWRTLGAQNAPERQPAPKQNGSAAWDDMLTTIRKHGGLRLSLGLRGSTLSHDAGEHKRRCQAVADIGGWAKLCELGEHNRGIIRAQFVAAYDRLGVTA